MALEKKNILILGGAGFLGSHLADHLVAYHQVICVDNFISGSQENIDHLLRNPNFAFIKHDMTMPLDLESYPELAKFKIKARGLAEIYNMACPTSAKNFEQHRLETANANSWGTKNALDLAVKYNAKFLHLSSSVVYGPRPTDKQPFSEENIGLVNHLTPRACYDEGKRFAETLVYTYRLTHDLDTKIARVFTAYGPRMKLFDGQMIPDFIVNALNGEDLTIYGDKEFSRSLCYVSDVIDGLVRLMESDINEPINFGSAQEITLAEVAKKIISLTKSSSKIVYQDPLDFMTPLGLPNIDKAKELLGWLPVVLLEDGLKKTIDYARTEKGTIRLDAGDF